MALIVADRIQETSTTTGNGALTLLGATTGYRAASTVCANGDTFTYYAEDVDVSGRPLGGWETGLGTWGTGNILTRTTIYASSNAGAAVVWAAGTRKIGLGLVANAAIGNTTVTGTLAVSGTATAPTPLTGATNSQIATTEFVQEEKEYLPALSQTLHYGTVVESLVYDTSRDSDGGLWRKRCTGTSWYNETLGGTSWIGQLGSETIARAYAARKSTELISNGTFSVDASGWTVLNSGVTTGGILSVVNGAVRIQNDATGTNYGVATTTINCIVGKTYVVTFARIGGSGAGYMAVGTGNIPSTYSTIIANQLATSFTFVATVPITYISIQAGAATASQYFDFDNISVREVDATIDATGALYQSTVDGKYYKLLTTTGTLEVFRGISREFPAVAAVVTESARVVIYDLTTQGCPMWMVFTNLGTNSNLLGGFGSSNLLAGIAALNARLNIALQGTYGGLITIDFVSDMAKRYRSIGSANGSEGLWNYGLASRNLTTAMYSNRTGGYVNGAIVSENCYDVAMVVLDSAPTDPATGMLVPTTALATGAGVSVIKQDGTAVNNTVVIQGSASTNLISFDKSGNFYVLEQTDHIRFGISYTSNWAAYAVNGGDLVITNMTAENFPPFIATSGATGISSSAVVGAGYFPYKLYPSTPLKSMLANVTTVYNTGWLLGDMRGAHLIDCVPETITGVGELITNAGPFTATTGWSAVHSATLSTAANELVATNGIANYPGASFSFTTVIGKTYILSGTVRSNAVGASPQTYLGVLDAAGNGTSQWAATASGTAAVYGAIQFVATGTTSYIGFGNFSALTGSGSVAYLVNVSVHLAEADRSTKIIGLGVNGSLTKSVVATGANLVTYSGFSAANYLDQPYNSNLDFGTGEWDISAWVSIPSMLQNILLYSQDLTQGSVWAGHPNYSWTAGVLTNASNVTATQGMFNQLAAAGNTTYTVAILASSGTTTSGRIAVEDNASDAVRGFNNITLTGTPTIYVATGTTAGGTSGVRVKVGTNGVVGTINVAAVGLFLGTVTDTQIIAAGGIPLTTTAAAYNPSVIAERNAASGPRITLGTDSLARFTAIAYDGTTTRTAVSAVPVTMGVRSLVSGTYKTDGSLSVNLNGLLSGTATGTALLTLNNTAATLTVGNNFAHTSAFQGSISHCKLTATAPTADQIAHIYRTELPLFQTGAQCVIAGTSTAVTSMSYDDIVDVTHIGTSWGRSTFKDLLRIDSEATTTGSLTSLAAGTGVLITSGTNAKVYIPAKTLREELNRKVAARKALGQVLTPQYFTATASQTVFTCSKGFDVAYVYINGLLKTPTTDYTVSDDGFQKIITTVSGVPVNQIVGAMLIRSA
jgi:hypothetical protein